MYNVYCIQNNYWNVYEVQTWGDMKKLRSIFMFSSGIDLMSLANSNPNRMDVFYFSYI